ncbi:Bud site selection protein 6 [Blastocladiella emersonii ATCC 22665]|nr:Bud site selection protein 6 [Blastocladiella emersonii ATCC 22665]
MPPTSGSSPASASPPPPGTPPPNAAAMSAAATLQASIKRITSACRALLLGLLDYSDISDEQVSLLYTAVVKAFFETCDEYEALGIDLDELRGFPDALRAALENVFEQAYSPSADTGPGDAPEDDAVSGEEINLLITRLIKGLQDRARAFLAGAVAVASAAAVAPPNGGASPTATLLTPPPHPANGYADHYGRRRSSSAGKSLSAAPSPAAGTSLNGTPRRRSSRSSSPLRTATNPEGGTVQKLYLQVGHEVKRVKYPKPAVDLATLQSLFVAKFQLVPPADPALFPKLYLQDPASQVGYELEDLRDVTDGCLLQLHTAPGTSMSPPTPPMTGAALAASLAAANRAAAAAGVGAVPAALPALQKKLAAVRTLRRDLHRLRAQVQDQALELRAVLAGIGEQLHAAIRAPDASSSGSSNRDSGIVDPSSAPSGADFNRDVLERTKAALTAATTGLGDRVGDLDDLVEQMRRDMVSRGAIPNRAALDYAAAELDELARAVTLAETQVDQVRPAWKAVWEHDLRRVVAEQDLLDRAETSLDDATQRLDAVAKLTAQLNRVATIAATNPDAVIPRRPAPEFGVPDAEEFEGLPSVMAELAAVLDGETAAALSERRVRAARRIETLRRWEREHRRDDFSWELRQFAGVAASLGEVEDVVAGRKSTAEIAPAAAPPTAGVVVAVPGGGRLRGLRSTGGVAALERARAEKEKETLRAIYASSQEAKAREVRPPSLNAS